MVRRTSVVGVSAAVGLLLAPASLIASDSQVEATATAPTANTVIIATSATTATTSVTTAPTTTTTVEPATTTANTTTTVNSTTTLLPSTTLPPTTTSTTTTLPPTTTTTTVVPCGEPLLWAGNVRFAVGGATVLDTGLVVAGGRYRIVVRTSDRYDTRAAAVEPYEQVFALVGTTASINSTDLDDGVVEASATSDLGIVDTTGGPLIMLHATERIGPTIEANGVSLLEVAVTPVC